MSCLNSRGGCMKPAKEIPYDTGFTKKISYAFCSEKCMKLYKKDTKRKKYTMVDIEPDIKKKLKLLRQENSLSNSNTFTDKDTKKVYDCSFPMKKEKLRSVVKMPGDTYVLYGEDYYRYKRGKGLIDEIGKVVLVDGTDILKNNKALLDKENPFKQSKKWKLFECVNCKGTNRIISGGKLSNIYLCTLCGRDIFKLSKIPE